MIETSELAVYRRLFDDKYAEIEQLLQGLPASALLWKPFDISPWQGPSASTGWLVAHAVSSIVYLLKRAEWTMGRIEWSAVDGDEGSIEFGPANHDPAYLLARSRRTQQYVHEFLARTAPAGLDVSRIHPDRPDVILTARYDVLHALEHLSQHIGHAQLTRQLWALSATRLHGEG
jgi:hypothetical protein